MTKSITNKRILIIGGTGSLGYALTRRLVGDNELFILSRDETKQWMMQNCFHGFNIGYHICDIRNLGGLKKALLDREEEIQKLQDTLKNLPSEGYDKICDCCGKIAYKVRPKP